jgi:hypothetical protein
MLFVLVVAVEVAVVVHRHQEQLDSVVLEEVEELILKNSLEHQI